MTENQRQAVYRKISEIKGWEETLRVRYEHLRRLAIDSSASPYLVGRADSFEEIIQLIRNAKKHGQGEEGDEGI